MKTHGQLELVALNHGLQGRWGVSRSVQNELNKLQAEELVVRAVYAEYTYYELAVAPDSYSTVWSA